MDPSKIQQVAAEFLSFLYHAAAGVEQWTSPTGETVTLLGAAEKALALLPELEQLAAPEQEEETSHAPASHSLPPAFTG